VSGTELSLCGSLTDGIRLHLPSLERHGDPVLSLAEFLLVGAAHQRALDVDVIALAQLSSGIFAEAVPRDDAMPLRFGVPFFVGTFPGPLIASEMIAYLRSVFLTDLCSGFLPR